jgi:hypothetical protein
VTGCRFWIIPEISGCCCCWSNCLFALR